MSLQYLGIAHFPVLHRQFSSPNTHRDLLEPSANQDITQDSKDVLIERLNDLVSRLSKDISLEDSTVDAIHAGVDQIEVLLHGGDKPRVASGNLESSQAKDMGEDVLWATPLTPTRNMRMPLADQSAKTSPSFTHQPHITIAKVDEMAKAAEDLAMKLAATVLEFQARMREADVSQVFQRIHHHLLKMHAACPRLAYH